MISPLLFIITNIFQGALKIIAFNAKEELVKEKNGMRNLLHLCF